MRFLGGAERAVATEFFAERQGLVACVLDLVLGWRARREPHQRQMHLVETLALGGKRQLMIVKCSGELFLVGGGVDCIQTIVRIKAEGSPGIVTKNLDEICQ